MLTGSYVIGERPLTAQHLALVTVAWAIPCASGALLIVSLFLLLPTGLLDFRSSANGAIITAILNVANVASVYSVLRGRIGPSRFRDWLGVAGILSAGYLSVLVVLAGMAVRLGG